MKKNVLQFRQRLAETIIWCQSRVNLLNPRDCLRSNELRPDYEYYDGPDDIDLWVDPLMVESLAGKRSEKLLEASDHSIITSPVDLQNGRILLVMLGYSNHNGGTASVSDYFFDHNDNPPWDTWIQVFPSSKAGDTFLLSWVPPEFIPAAENAIPVECIGMLMWADQAEKSELSISIPTLFGVMKIRDLLSQTTKKN